VPFESDLLGLLEDAGFVSLRMMKFDAKPCFIRDGVKMRELQLEGFTPLASEVPVVEVMYRGPFKSIRMDDGQVLERGQRGFVPASIAARFQSSELASQFTVFEANADRTISACGS
jgi:hypothetical protein